MRTGAEKRDEGWGEGPGRRLDARPTVHGEPRAKTAEHLKLWAEQKATTLGRSRSAARRVSASPHSGRDVSRLRALRGPVSRPGRDALTTNASHAKLFVVPTLLGLGPERGPWAGRRYTL